MLNPFEWKDKPALIEHLFPVQKISAESYKEQMAGAGKTLTALGSYWKGRKPLILNKACILGCLLPATDDHLKDLEIFELLMGMDSRSMAIRHGRIKPADIANRISGLQVSKWFDVAPQEAYLPDLTPFNVKDFPFSTRVKNKQKTLIPKLKWKDTITEKQKLEIESQALPFDSFQQNVSSAKRAEENADEVHRHIWKNVNKYLGTTASTFPELIEQMGIARFGRRPKLADVFCGSGQIPFEAARLGCDVYASDLNPIACMLTWGSFNIVGASSEKRKEIDKAQKELAVKVQKEIDALGVETDGKGWRAKVYLYCIEVVCPESRWKVPLLPSFIISKGYQVIAKLIPVPSQKRYDIEIVSVEDYSDVKDASVGTIQKGSLVHSPDGITTYRVSINTIRGDYKEARQS